MLGAVLALCSAAAFSVNSILIRRGVVRTSPTHAAFITVVMGLPMFVVAALVSGQLLQSGDLALSGYGYLAAGGVINFIVGRQLNYMAIEALGAARAAPFQALTLPYSVLIAFLFLGEGVSWFTGIGVALIVIGPAVMVERRKRVPVVVAAGPVAVEDAPAFVPRQLEGYVTAALASVAYGTSPILFRAAVAGHSGLTILSGTVAYAAATAVLLASTFFPARRYLVRSLEPQTLRLYFGASASVFAAQMFRFLALSVAPVAVVTALERMNSVFTLGLSYHMNRLLELITPRVALGVAISLAGTLLLVAGLAS
jgi:drug/metabolite transporter (DMT)-like permease